MDKKNLKLYCDAQRSHLYDKIQEKTVNPTLIDWKYFLFDLT